jgi:hypothetical protein
MSEEAALRLRYPAACKAQRGTAAKYSNASSPTRPSAAFSPLLAS